ncbi:MAG: MFS transporter [Methanobacteriaceae archaeon]|nr:MFS transporter [Methanobacteriaceae archaeon]
MATERGSSSTVLTSKSTQIVCLTSVVISSFLIPFMGSSVNIALPLIQNDLSVDILILGWIPMAFVLANAALVLTFGRLADIHGRKKVFTWGLIVYILASFLAGFSNSGTILVLFSFLQGVGCAMIFATGVALLISIFPHKRRGEILGIYLTSVYVGLFMGPLLGGFLAQWLGWRSIFFANIPLGLFALILILAGFEGEWKSSSGKRFDKKGSIIYIVSLSTFIYGVSTFQDFSGKILLMVGLMGLIIFLHMERKSKNPVLPVTVFKNQTTKFSGLALLMITVATSGIWTLLSLYLQDLRGLDPFISALILAVQPMAVAFLSPLVGRMADKSDKSFLNITGTILCTIGLLILAIVGERSSLTLVLGGLLIIGVGMGFFSTPTNRNFLKSLTSTFYAVGSAALSTMVYVGQTVSLGVLLFILTIYMGNAQLTAEKYPLFMDGMHISFIIFAIFSLLAAYFTLRVKEKNQ